MGVHGVLPPPRHAFALHTIGGVGHEGIVLRSRLKLLPGEQSPETSAVGGGSEIDSVHRPDGPDEPLPLTTRVYVPAA